MPMDCQGVFCNDEKSVVKDTTSLQQLSLNLTKQPVEELKPLSPEMSTSQWRQKILSNWKYIKNNMNPIPVSKELHSSGFIRNDIVNQFMCQRRAVQATLLLIVSVPKIINEDKYKTFVQILCKSMIGLTDELGKDMQHSKVVPASLPNQRSLLEINRLQLTEKLQELYPVEFLLIVDDFVESGIFDIEDVADIISIRQFACKSREEASKSLIDKIISKSEQGSYTYLVRNLEKYGNRFQKILLELKDTPKPIIPDIKISDITLVETHIKMIDEQKEPKNGILTLTLNNKKNEDTENKIKDMVVSVNHDLLKNGLMLDKVTTGSVMIHIKSLDGDIRKQMIKMVNDNSMVSILEKLFHQTDIQKVLTEGKIRVEMKFETTQTNEYLIKGNEPPKCPPVSMIDANKSFLIEEIDTYTLSKAFEKKNIKSFIDANLETIPLREERAIHFLQILQRENLVGEFKKIVKEENMTIISERLQTYERVHATESQSLSQNICKSVTNIIRALDIDDVKDTFVERNIFEAGMFEDMEEKYQCLEREQLMGLFIAEILRSGTDAVLTFVDALYMNNMDQIANDILEPFPKNKECSIIKPTKKEESKDDSQSSLVFTGAFEFSVQIEGTEQANAISYLNKTTKNTPENSVEIQKTLEIWRKNDEMFVDTRAARHVHKCIKASNCITVTGSSGLGKTATVRHVALLMAYDGYKIIPITDPCDISNFYIPFCKTLFVVDDLCDESFYVMYKHYTSMIRKSWRTKLMSMV